MRIWDADTGETIGAPIGHTIGSTVTREGIRQFNSVRRFHTGTVSSVAFSPDGRRIVSGSSDHAVRVWDAGSGAMIGSPLTGHSNPKMAVR